MRTTSNRFMAWMFVCLLPVHGAPGQARIATGVDIERLTLAKSDAWGPENPTAVGDYLYFTYFDVAHGRELWITDGTGEGTRLVRDIKAGPQGSVDYGMGLPIMEFVHFHGRVFFTAHDAEHGMALWASDGSEEGTNVISDLEAPGDGGPDLEFIGPPAWGFTVVGDQLYFSGYDGEHGYELWTTGGTPGSTRLVRDIRPGVEGSYPIHLTEFAERLFFVVRDGEHGSELWTSDGTSAGTYRVGENLTPEAGRYPCPFAAVGASLYWASSDSSLWITDGTAAGTHVVRSSSTAPIISELSVLRATGDLVFFTAQTSGHGRELWVTDGTEAGTRLVRDIYEGTSDSWPREITAVGGRVFFTAEDAEHGRELWTSDGTREGTSLARDIFPGAQGSSPAWLTPANDRLIFAAEHPTTGRELWESDGTMEGTSLVCDVAPGPIGSSVAPLTIAGGRLFFDADDFENGRQLWTMLLEPTAVPPPRFLRADTNADQILDLSDAIATLTFLFSGGAPPPCLDAADANDSGLLDISDGVFTLGYLFLGTAAPPASFGECGEDPTEDGLRCETAPSSCQ